MHTHGLPAPTDTLSLSTAFRNYNAELLAFTRARLPEPGEAADLLQDIWATFVKTVKSSLNDEAIHDPRAWLYRAVRNRLTDIYRRRKHVPKLVAVDPGEDEGGFYGSTADDGRLEDLDARLAISTAMYKLPEPQYDVFLRNVIYGETLRSISADLDIPLKTIVSRKRYACSRLRKLLQEVYDEYFDN